ncbi:MAG TPA: DUF4386 domain-containing protein [Anaerolineae bacterium]|nr:DUF4386 domain-containing protein [Anaerolineae bacterium]
MTIRTAKRSPRFLARITALLVLAIFGLVYIPSMLFVPGDAAITASNIMVSESLFRLGIVSNLIVQIVGIFWVLVLYQLLVPVNKNMATLMVIFYLLSVPIALLNELNKFAILHLAGDAGPTVFTPNQLQTLVSLFLKLHTDGINIAGIFWGLWLFPLGYLVFKSGFLPRVIGILLIIGCLGFLVQSFAGFLWTNFGVNIVALTDWGELLLPLWLLIKGVDVEQWKKRAAVPA